MRHTLSLALAAALTLSLAHLAQAERFFNPATGRMVGSPDIPPSFTEWNKRWREQKEIRSICRDRWRTDEAIKRCIDKKGRY